MSIDEHIEMENDKYLPDSSVILSGQITSFIKSLTGLEKIEIILSRIVLAEIENRANQDKTTGIIGLERLRRFVEDIRDEVQSTGKSIEFTAYGQRPSLEQVKLNSGGELDAAIRLHAKETDAVLVTSDRIQYDMAQIEQVKCLFLEPIDQISISGQRLQTFFDDHSMSVHLKNGCYPMAKKGRPGHWKLIKIGDEILSRDDIQEIESNIIAEAQLDEDSFIEKDLPGVTVVQLNKYRIVICRPPFADGNEITAVRPLVKLTLDDYDNIKPLMQRLDRAEGILVCGSPGAGKSTFISALTEYYLEQSKIVKTLESVRDLQVPPEVSQYGELDGDFEKTADILLLVRPDFTIFDEIRTSDDFKIFSDMRLAGVGMVGVVHSSSALDAIQRFIRRIELGIIPSVVDTVISIKEGQINEILNLQITVKVPTGFRDQGLARPVIEVANYTNGRLLFEIYEFGSNVVVNPIGGGYRKRRSYSKKRSKQRYKSKKKYRSSKKKRHKNNKKFYEYEAYDTAGYEDNLMDELENAFDGDLPDGFEDAKVLKFGVVFGKNSLVLKAGSHYGGQYVDVYADDQFIASYQMNKYGDIKVSTDTPLYRKLDKAIQEEGREIYGKIVPK